MKIPPKTTGTSVEEYKTYRRDTPVTANGRKSGVKKQAKSNTVNMELKTLKTIFKLAVLWKEMQENPLNGVKRLPVDDAKPPRFLTGEEVQKLLSTASGQLKDIWTVFVYSGMRKAELENLMWTDIDFKRDKIKIQQKPDWQPKTGIREISMHEKLKHLLQRLQKENTCESEFVFYNADGGKLKRKLRRDLMSLTKACGFPDVTKIHSLRHTFASGLVMSGVSLAVVQEELGHSDVETTMIYAHLTPKHRANAVNKLSFE